MTTLPPRPTPARPAPARPAAQRPLKVRVQLALRSLHVYTSMLSLMLTLFFALSGILVNHPGWLPVSPSHTVQAHGTLPAGWGGAAHPDWFRVSEYLRATHHLSGRASDVRADGSEASVIFRAPGYHADIVIGPDGRYDLTAQSDGLLAVIGDLHRGRDAGRAWPWLIDASGVFLLLVSLSGLGILLYLKKYRRPALLTLAGGAAVSVLLASLTR